MGGLVRDRGCLYYVPWIVIAAMCILGGGTGVWIYFGHRMYNFTSSGFDALGVTAKNQDSLQPTIIATSVVILTVIVLLFALSIARSFVEAAHDATGLSGQGTFAWMVLAAIVGLAWWGITIWSIVVVLTSSAWAATVYIMREGIKYLLDHYGPQPDVSWLPSQGMPCPAKCYDLTQLAFINTAFSNSCTCNYDQLRAAYSEFDSSNTESSAVLAGAWTMMACCLILLVNFACQWSHTKREREYIKRLVSYQYYQ